MAPGWALVGQPILVAVNAKKSSPLAAVTWSNGLKGAVYYLNEKNIICERVTKDDGKTWHDGSLTELAIPVRANSDLAAVATWESLRHMEIYVYFQDQTNRIRELRFGLEGCEWYEHSPTGGKLPKGLSGTSIVCAADSALGVKRWVYSQSPTGGIHESVYKADGDTWGLHYPHQHYFFTQGFDRNARLGYSADPRNLRVYAHDGSKVLEKVRTRVGVCKWEDQVILPMGAGTAQIKENFVVLLWPQDIDNTASEVHLFSTEGGILHDYQVGPATGGEFSLTS